MLEPVSGATCLLFLGMYIGFSLCANIYKPADGSFIYKMLDSIPCFQTVREVQCDRHHTRLSNDGVLDL